MRNGKTLQKLLVFLGSFAIFIGLVTAFYTYFILRPKLVTLSNHVSESLGALESTVQVLEQNESFFSASLNGIQAGAKIADMIPETLITLKGTLMESAELLEASSSTTKEVKEGISGLVMPDEELAASGKFMRKTATQLQLMAGMVDQLQNATSDLSSHTTEISNQLSQINDTLGPLTQQLQRVRIQIRDTRDSLNSLSFPTQVSLAGICFGGLYIFLGASLLALAPIYARPLGLVQVEYSHAPVPTYAKDHPKKAS